MISLPSFSKKNKIKTIGVLCSGGDAPGMNAAIRAVVRTALDRNVRVFGIERGYAGIFKDRIKEMNASSVANIIQRGGTILKTSRCPEFHQKKYRKKAAEILRKFSIEGLVVIGGDGSFRGADLFSKENNFPVVGVPGTIDNDIPCSEDTIGFDTAVNTAIEAIDRIRDTASSHERLFLVEVMGRSSGNIAIQVAIGGGAETAIIPENKESIQSIVQTLERGISRGKTSSIIIVAEGSTSGTSYEIAKKLKKAGHDSRVCILGHIQRGGRPTAHDRMLASALGGASVGYLCEQKKTGMVGVWKNETCFVPFTKVNQSKSRFEKSLVSLAKQLAT